MKLGLKALLAKHRKVTKKNLGKLIYTLFLMSIIESFMSLMLLGPILRTSAGDTASYALFAVGTLLFFLLQFGFASMLLRMTRNEFVTLGFLFYGFTRPKISLGPAAAFTIMAFIVIFISRFLFAFIFPELLEVATKSPAEILNIAERAQSAEALSGNTELVMQSKALVYPSLIFLAAFTFLALIPFAFTFQFKLDNQKKSVFWAMKKSLSTVFTDFNYIKTIALAFLASWKRILLALPISALMFISIISGGTLITIVFHFFFLLNFYTALIQIMMAVPIVYQDATQATEKGLLIDVKI